MFGRMGPVCISQARFEKTFFLMNITINKNCKFNNNPVWNTPFGYYIKKKNTNRECKIRI